MRRGFVSVTNKFCFFWTMVLLSRLPLLPWLLTLCRLFVGSDGCINNWSHRFHRQKIGAKAVYRLSSLHLAIIKSPSLLL